MAEITNTAIDTFYSLVGIFFVCELGENITHLFNIFSEKLCGCCWYLYPIEMQRIFLIFLSGTEQSAVILGYANIACTRDAFKNVILVCV